MDLEPLGGSAVGVFDDLALESDVGDLDPGTRVGAAVEVDGDRDVEFGVEVGQALLEFGDQGLRARAGFSEGQLAELDSAARHEIAPPVGGSRWQPQCVQAGNQLIEPVVGHVQNYQFLIGREPDAVRADLLGQIGNRGQDGSGHPTGYRGHADGVESIAETLHSDVIDRMQGRFWRGAVDQGPLEILLFENCTEFLHAPVLHEELQSCLRPEPAIAVIPKETDNGFPDIGNLIEWYPCAEALSQHGVG